MLEQLEGEETPETVVGHFVQTYLGYVNGSITGVILFKSIDGKARMEAKTFRSANRAWQWTFVAPWKRMGESREHRCRVPLAKLGMWTTLQ